MCLCNFDRNEELSSTPQKYTNPKLVCGISLLKGYESVNAQLFCNNPFFASPFCVA